MRITIDRTLSPRHRRSRRRPARFALATVGRLAVLAICLSNGPAPRAEPGVYQSPEDFVADAFPAGAPDASAIWLRADLRDAVQTVLGRPPLPRIRYWRQDQQTVWILEEIGKDQPITAGIIVRDGAITEIRVLVFRESRGWEIRHAFFTRQYRSARLTDGNRLDRPIDGITGATLSVQAMTRMAKVALLLDAQAAGRAPSSTAGAKGLPHDIAGSAASARTGSD